MRRLQALSNRELSTILEMRNHHLESWLVSHEGPIYITLPELGERNPKRCVHYREAKKYTLPIMECLAELEARISCKYDSEKTYLIKAASSI